MSLRLFEDDDHAEVYHKFRPSYPQELIDCVISRCKINQISLKNAADIGCGSGQITNLLADHFDQITGIDVSAAQINQAKKNNRRENIEYKTGFAEELPFEDSSLSLVICASSFHWFDKDKFLQEVKRVLMPGGCVALIGYKLNSFDPSVCDAIYNEFIYKTLKGFLAEEAFMAIDGYRNVVLPFHNVLRRDDFEVRMKMPLSKYMSFLGSCSGYRNYTKKHPDTDILQQLEEKFSAALASTNSSTNKELTAIFPYYLLIGCKDV